MPVPVKKEPASTPPSSPLERFLSSFQQREKDEDCGRRRRLFEIGRTDTHRVVVPGAQPSKDQLRTSSEVEELQKRVAELEDAVVERQLQEDKLRARITELENELETCDGAWKEIRKAEEVVKEAVADGKATGAIRNGDIAATFPESYKYLLVTRGVLHDIGTLTAQLAGEGMQDVLRMQEDSRVLQEATLRKREQLQQNAEILHKERARFQNAKKGTAKAKQLETVLETYVKHMQCLLDGCQILKNRDAQILGMRRDFEKSTAKQQLSTAQIKTLRERCQRHFRNLEIFTTHISSNRRHHAEKEESRLTQLALSWSGEMEWVAKALRSRHTEFLAGLTRVLDNRKLRRSELKRELEEMEDVDPRGDATSSALEKVEHEIAQLEAEVQKIEAVREKAENMVQEFRSELKALGVDTATPTVPNKSQKRARSAEDDDVDATSNDDEFLTPRGGEEKRVALDLGKGSPAPAPARKWFFGLF